MKYQLILSVLIFLSQTVVNQKIEKAGPEEMSMESRLDMGHFKKIQDCGHVLDGPSYFMKEMENNTLDAALPSVNFNEEKLGREIYHEIIKTNRKLNNHKAEPEIREIISNLTGHMPNSEKRDFKLSILDSKEVNAYTTIGSYIYITSGLINFIDSADELSFIIGHEIGHDVLKHTQRKITKILLTSKVLNKVNLEDYSDLALTINTKISAPFDQVDEYEADKYGAQLATRAGYDNQRFTDFFRKIEKNEHRSIINKITSTHPFASNRRKCIHQYISN